MDLTDQTLFKSLNGLRPRIADTSYRYPGVGQWTRHLDPSSLAPCKVGYHIARGAQVLEWLGPTIYVAEACPDHGPIEGGDKLVTCRVRLVERLNRWNETTARLFAADCAEVALLAERAAGREPDERSWAAVVAARRFARGDIDRSALGAAGDAARAAAGDAARSAAGDAAWNAARSAARSAARAAAGDAARSAAGDAAWNAAGDAARSAAGAAAGAAARDKQYGRLCAYLTGDTIPEVEPLYGPGEN